MIFCVVTYRQKSYIELPVILCKLLSTTDNKTIKNNEFVVASPLIWTQMSTERHKCPLTKALEEPYGFRTLRTLDIRDTLGTYTSHLTWLVEDLQFVNREI